MRNRLWMALLCAIPLWIVACDDDDDDVSDGHMGYDAAPYAQDAEVLDFGPEFEEVHLDGGFTHAQPQTGIVFWPDQARALDSTYNQSISMEFAYCLPSDVVLGKEEGRIVYDWSPFENLLNDISSRNHQAVIRFRYEYPSGETVSGPKGSTAVPAYIKALPDYHETFSADPAGDGPTYYADWSNAELQWFTKQFYVDFAARYGHDPRIAFLEVGFGHWSEYHIYGTALSLGENFPSKAYQLEFLSVLSTEMSIPWLISIDSADDTYSPIDQPDRFLSLGFGLFDDSFMHEEHELAQGDGYNESCFVALDQGTRWQTRPMGGEISYYNYPDDQYGFLNPQGLYGVTWAEASAKYHVSFMIANDAPEGPYATAARVKEASLQSGYRFSIKEIRTDHHSTSVLITNLGTAPIYRDAYLQLGSNRSQESLIQLLPGQERWITLNGDASTEKLTIECDDLLKTQRIEFDM